MIAFAFPGQGSQQRGMGADLFNRYSNLCDAAEKILGYSVKDLCLNDTDNRLQQTQYTQPALFVVNALTYLAKIEREPEPELLAGHSLGEYSALFAARCFDFETGVRLTQKRGELMSRATGGSMVAVLGLEEEQLNDLLKRGGLTDIDIANYNAPDQLILSGPQAALGAMADLIKQNGVGRCVALNVSAAFHSRYMEEASAAFESFLQEISFAAPGIPVISNVTAHPHEPDTIGVRLVQQIRKPVLWCDTMRYMMEQGVSDMEEIGPGQVLTKLWRSARQRFAACGRAQSSQNHFAKPAYPAPEKQSVAASRFEISPENLGCAEFCRDYKIRYAYLAGSMFKGIASEDLVIRMGKAGLIGFFGTGGLKLPRIEDAIHTIQRELGPQASYGMNLLYAMDNPRLEEATVDLYLRKDVRFAEAAAYLQITPPLVRFRFKGAHRDAAGRPVAIRHVIAKVSRPEIAAAFMQPPPENILARLVQEGKLAKSEAEVARQLPVSDDICVEADSGGHTDGGVAYALIPSIIRLRDEEMARHDYPKKIRVGAAGGIGTAEAAAAAFILGADFIITGSINQCSPEAGTSTAVKDLLAQLDAQDTAYAPAGDMFEMGAKVQVVRKGTLFPARANKLYQVYRQYASLGQIDEQTRRTIQENYFKRSFEEVWEETRNYLSAEKVSEIEKAERNPKHKMALVFRWYFIHSIRAALRGNPDEKANYQIHCGPAMGAFNRFIKGTEMENWQNRHVELIAERLMQGAAIVLGQRLRKMTFSSNASAAIL